MVGQRPSRPQEGPASFWNFQSWDQDQTTEHRKLCRLNGLGCRSLNGRRALRLTAVTCMTQRVHVVLYDILWP